VAEAAVVGINDELTGQAVNAFVALKEGTESSDQVKKDLMLQVRKSIGPFAAPKAIFVVPDLPKTRSGKIMRRIMRKILAGEEDQLGDTSTVSATLRGVRCWARLLVTRSWWGTGLTACYSSRIHQ
jgi:acetyl-CoA synthetase